MKTMTATTKYSNQTHLFYSYGLNKIKYTKVVKGAQNMNPSTALFLLRIPPTNGLIV